MWGGLSLWALTLGSGALLGFGAGLNAGAPERQPWSSAMAPRIAHEVLLGVPEPARERRLLAWLEAVPADQAVRAWAQAERLSLDVATPGPAPAIEEIGETDLPLEIEVLVAARPVASAPVAAAVATVPAAPPPVVAAVAPAVLAVAGPVPVAPATLPETEVRGRLVVGEIDLFSVVDAPEARREVLRRVEGWRACYEAALSEHPTLTGLLELSFAVADGLVSDIRTTLNTVGDQAVGECAAADLAGWSFPSAVKGPIRVPVHLKPVAVDG
jgi:hypothetical protein